MRLRWTRSRIRSCHSLLTELVRKSARILRKGGGMTALRRVQANGEVWVELSVWKSSTGRPSPGLFVREADVYRER